MTSWRSLKGEEYGKPGKRVGGRKSLRRGVRFVLFNPMFLIIGANFLPLNRYRKSSQRLLETKRIG